MSVTIKSDKSDSRKMSESERLLLEKLSSNWLTKKLFRKQNKLPLVVRNPIKCAIKEANRNRKERIRAYEESWWKQQTSAEKRLIPLQRETTELLMLVYMLLESCGIKPGDTPWLMTAKSAWLKIISKEFSSELIAQIKGVSVKYIVLNNGKEVRYREFSNTFNKRFR